MRKIFETAKIDDKFARVYRDSDAQEYVVRFYQVTSRCTLHYDASDYFTDDREDAIATAKHAIYRMMKRRKLRYSRLFLKRAAFIREAQIDELRYISNRMLLNAR